MNAFKQRPFAFACFFAVLLLFVSFYLDVWTKIAIIALCSLSIFLLFSTQKKHRFILLYIIPPIIISFLVSIFFFSINYRNILTYADKQYECEFTVNSEEYTSESYSSYKITLNKIGNKKISFSSILYYDGKLDTPLYTSYSSTLRFSLLKGSDDSTAPNYSYLSKGVYLSCSAETELTEKGSSKPFPSYYFHKINSFLSELFNKNLDNQENALIQAIILGNKNMLSKQTKYNFRALGLSHILAVSGLHLSILIGSLGKLIEKTGISKKKLCIIMIIIIFLYAGITGFSSSVKRAAIMLILFYASFLISKSHDSITALCGALAFICLASPGSVFDIGLWLSFLSTYGILQVALPITKEIEERTEYTSGIIRKAALKIWSSLLLGIIPVVFSLPVLWLSYGEVAILSPLTNILFTPLLLILMYCSPFAMMCVHIPVLSKLTATISSFSAHIMLVFSSFLADHSPIISIDYDFTYIIMALFVLSIFLLTIKNVKNKYLYLTAFILSASLFLGCASLRAKTTKDDQKLIYTNTYTGEAFLVISQNKGLICDISGVSFQNASDCEYYLGKNNITSLESYVVTDYNGRGVQTLKNLISLTKLKNLYIPLAQSEDEGILKKSFSDFAKDNNISLTVYDLGAKEQIDFYGITIDIKRTSNNYVNSPSSFCVSFSNGETSYNYIGLNSYSDFKSYSVPNEWFVTKKNLIFGSYGQAESIGTIPLLYQDSKNLFFADENIYSLYNKSIPKSSNITIINDCFVFHLKR